jgi:hypothetical protein
MNHLWARKKNRHCRSASIRDDNGEDTDDDDDGEEE